MSSPTVYHRFSLTRPLLMIVVLFVALLPVAAFAASVENETLGGEVRSEPPAQPHAPTAALVVTNTDDSGVGSLRDAVSVALPGDTITFAPTLAGQVITLISGEIGIDKPLTIDGANAPGVTVSGNNASRIFSASGGALTVNNLIMTQGYTEDAGGAIFASVPLTLSSVSIISNTAYGGGGVEADAAFNITGSQFLSNTASGSGGGLSTINIDNATATLINVSFISNIAYGSGGYGGGGMISWGNSPTLMNVIFISNTVAGYEDGGGMYNIQSSPTLTNVTFISNTAEYRGGAMVNYEGSSPTLINVTFTGNSAAENVGGVYNEGNALTLVNVTFNANFAGTYQAGVGGMESFQSVLTLTNVTFNANPGGMVNLASNFTVVNSTFTGNDYALFNTLGSTGTVTNSILWGNTGDQIYNSDSVLTVTYSDVQGGYPGLGNLDADPRLGPLGNYGGFVDTIPLLAGSAAIDSGDDDACPTTDARGVTRPQGRHCDLGAYESPYTLTLTAANSSPTVLGNPTAFTATLNTSLAPITYTWDFGEGSLGSGQSLTWTYGASGMYTAVVTAITDAIILTATTRVTITDQPIISLTVISDSPTVLGSPTVFTATVTSGTNITYAWDFGDGSTIVSGPSAIISHTYGAVGAYTATVTATNSISTAVATTPVTIICIPGAVVLNTDDAGCGSLRDAVSVALPGDTVTFTPTLAGQVITLTSGEIGIDKLLTIDGANAPGVTVSGNNASRIFNASGGALTVNNLILTHGHAEGAGGAIYASVPLTLSGVSIISNTATEDGGGVHMDGTYVDGAFNITGSQFLSNTASGSGGGLSTSNFNNETATLTNVIFSSNSAQIGGSGGGMANSESNVTLINVTFISNTAAYGGGMANVLSSPTLTNVTFISNTAEYGDGGGMYNSWSSPTLISVTFISNTAADRGGGMVNYEGSSPTLINVTFTGNSAADNVGGVYNEGNALTLVNVTFNANFAGTYQAGVGGMESFQSVLTLTNVTFNANPGGMVNLASNFTVANSTFTGNDYALFSTLGSTGTVTNSILWGNTGDQIHNDDSDSVITVTYSDVQGGYPGLGNLNADPRLGPLGNYGGFVDTIPLLAGSAAIDSGDDDACPTTDARGVTRPQGRHCDLGAYESPYTLTLTAANSSPTVLGNPTAFTATLNTSLAPITYTWDFGEGSLGSGQSPTWTYGASGMYTAVVTATTDAITLTATTRVTITDQPIISLTVINDSPTVLGSPTVFTATASGSSIVYTWNFGDSSPVFTGSSSVITHPYGTAGIYTTVVTAANSVSNVSAQTTVLIASLPVAAAGADQIVHTGQSAILNGSASLDPGGFLPLTYHWQQIGGQAVALSSADHVTVTFTTPQAVTQTITLTFALTVTNTLSFASQPDFVAVSVEPYRVYLPLALR